MEIDRLPGSLLNGTFLHCRPVEDGPIVEAKIVSAEDVPSVAFNMAIICPVRAPRSNCYLRIRARSKDKHCLYYRGDSRGVYQIIGPNSDKKSERGWED